MKNKTRKGLRLNKDNWFTCIDTEVMRDEYLMPSEKLVYAALCIIAGFGDRTCSPTIEELVDISGFSVRAVRHALAELDERDIINCEGQTIHLIGHNAPCYSQEDEADEE